MPIKGSAGNLPSGPIFGTGRSTIRRAGHNDLEKARITRLFLSEASDDKK